MEKIAILLNTAKDSFISCLFRIYHEKNVVDAKQRRFHALKTVLEDTILRL